MAKITSAFKLRGTINGITFRQTKYGNIAARKSSISAKRIASDPAFKRTRELNEVFKKASTASATLSRLIKSNDIKLESNVHSKLLKTMMQILKAGKTNDNETTFRNEHLNLLKEHNFNHPHSHNLPRIIAERKENVTIISVENFNPDGYQIGNNTHVGLVLLHLELDLNNNIGESSCLRTEMMFCYRPYQTESFQFEIPHKSNTPMPIVIGLGLEPRCIINGKYYAGSKNDYPPFAITHTL